jgi:hypothetical protein
MKNQIMASLLVVGAGFLASDAEATQVNVSAFSFNPADGDDEMHIIRRPDLGIAFSANGSAWVEASLDHSPSPNGVQIYYDGFMQGESVTMWCGVTSINYDGVVLFSTNFQVLGYHGAFEQVLSLSASQAPVWAYITVGCELPPSQLGWLYGVTAVNL